MFQTSILNRLIIIFFSLIASSLIFFSVYMLDIFNNYSLNAIKENLHITIKNVQFFLMQPNNKEYLQQATIKPYLTELAKVNNINIHILDIDKNLLVSSASTTPDLNSFENLASLKTDFNKIKEYIYMYIKYVPYNNNNPKYYKDSVNCSIFYIPINKIITKLSDMWGKT